MYCRICRCIWEMDKRQIFSFKKPKIRHSFFSCFELNPFPNTTILQQTTLNIFCLKIENLYNWMDNLWLKWKTLWQKEKLLILSNFFLCHYVFKKLFAAEASESIYMRERVKAIIQNTLFNNILGKHENMHSCSFNNVFLSL